MLLVFFHRLVRIELRIHPVGGGKNMSINDRVRINVRVTLSVRLHPVLGSVSVSEY